MYVKQDIIGSVSEFVRDPSIIAYFSDPPFDPPKVFEELSSLVSECHPENSLYQMVRDLLRNLGLDSDHHGDNNWSPFRQIIEPGQTVLIKPNLVTHRHYLGNDLLYSTIIHGSVIRPFIDYAYLALQGSGKIIIADNPVEGSDFEKMMAFTGIRQMVEILRKRGYKNLELIDLRPRVLKEAKDGDFYYEDQSGDPLGYVTIDLGKESQFAELDNNRQIHYYTLADNQVDHFDPKFSGTSTTDAYHNSNNHKYIVSKSILNADAIINIAKMKSHCKSGVSLTLKNMIGIVYDKYCMPHHRPGLAPDGDSFPKYPDAHYVVARKSYVKLRKWIRLHQFPGFRTVRDWLQKNKILVGQHIEHGNWKGNDTIWRTILDLNRIVLYADRNGVMHDTPQRNMFAVIDGIISQQGEAPINGEAVPTSVVVGGCNPVMVDALAVKLMGLDYRLFKSIAMAEADHRWPLLLNGQVDFDFRDRSLPDLKFKLSKGWS